jgi:bacterioferritin-associated ferredoxin
MAVKVDGKKFTGVTYNQGAFSGDRGHLFILGMQQCSYSLAIQSRNRVWQKLITIAKLEQVIADGNICSACAKNVTQLIEANKTKEAN